MAAEAGAAATHWAFAAPERPQLPPVTNAAWGRTPIDAFVLARLEAEGLSPSPDADLPTLIRRLSLDLRGLPPTLEEIDTFLADRSPEAYERLVERFLADPAYGEKRASYWLDLARFGDTNGYQDDGTRSMWAYRDYVIRAFNDNRPFDQFTLENIAGDLLEGSTREQKIASGFNRNHRFNEEGGADPDEFRVAYSIDRVNTTATTWLGLTFECAQCHDHKYDPISQKEYYQFYAFFNSNEGELGVSKTKKQPPFLELPTAAQAKERARLAEAVARAEETLAEMDGPLQGRFLRWHTAGRLSEEEKKKAGADEQLAKIVDKPAAESTDDEKKRLRTFYVEHNEPAYVRAREKRDEFRALKRKVERQIPTTLVMQTMKSRLPAFVLERGDFRRPGERVEPGVPGVFPALGANRAANRLDLARWLVAPENPLVARVLVNRVWGRLFGSGLVRTVNDFGTRGEFPSHPKVLDWLATELLRLDWDVKELERQIVTSATYRQASTLTESSLRSDPTNRFLARASRFRLRAEEVRDNALAVAGLLSRKIGGPSVMPYQPEGYFADKSRDWKWTPSPGGDRYRRGVYTFWRRTTPYPSLVIFDAPSRELCVAERARTISPQQALMTLNDPVFVEAARVFAERICADGPPGIDQKLRQAFRLAVARRPAADDLEVLRALYQEEFERFSSDPAAATKLASQGSAPAWPGLEARDVAVWTSLASVLLNLDETVMRE